MNTTKILLFVAAITTAAVVLLLAINFNAIITSRYFYRQIDINAETQLLWLNTGGSFSEEYQKARRSGEAWTQDPAQTALRLAGYPNPDDAQPTKVSVKRMDKKTATVFILADNLADDSVSAREYRIDLVEENKGWAIEWAGKRWQCARNYYTGWTTQPCS